MEPLPAAQELVASAFPDALAAFLGGNVLSSRRTVTSDLDILVVVPGPPAPYRETIRYGDWLVELFVHTEASVRHYFGKDRDRRHPALSTIAARGVVLADPAGIADAILAEANALLEAGPPELTQSERTDLRYALSGLIDDLTGATDHDELVFIANHVFEAAAQLYLLDRRLWPGTFKWLGRRLLDEAPALHARLLAAHRSVICAGEIEPLRATAMEILDRAGGWLQEGYLGYGEVPAAG
ncbi:MAG TPA: nucleotidyltransferase domain-containing protein [Actinomycetes bacterium]|nr:nucleotidyltransferase domain-containing protein [Actinomycetes bacterium]